MKEKTLEHQVRYFMEQFQDDMYPELHDGIMQLVNKAYDTGYQDYLEMKKLLDK